MGVLKQAHHIAPGDLIEVPAYKPDSITPLGYRDAVVTASERTDDYWWRLTFTDRTYVQTNPGHAFMVLTDEVEV